MFCPSSVLKAVMVEAREEGLFVSTLEMMSWMTASAPIRRKSLCRGAMSSLVRSGKWAIGQR
jgi:hypothetical protein